MAQCGCTGPATSSWDVDFASAQPPDDLRRLVGGDYWDDGRFDAALAFALADGLVVVTAEGTVAAV